MIAALSDSKLTMLAWVPLPPKGVYPQDGALALFSDGHRFWLGTREEYEKMQFQDSWRATFWAKLNDLSAILGARA